MTLAEAAAFPPLALHPGTLVSLVSRLRGTACMANSSRCILGTFALLHCVDWMHANGRTCSLPMAQAEVVEALHVADMSPTGPAYTKCQKGDIGPSQKVG